MILLGMFQFEKTTPKMMDPHHLGGGFNRFEKISQIGNLPQVGMNIKNI